MRGTAFDKKGKPRPSMTHHYLLMCPGLNDEVFGNPEEGVKEIERPSLENPKRVFGNPEEGLQQTRYNTEETPEADPPPTQKQTRGGYSDEFEVAWKVYPRGTGKKEAWGKWKARIKEGYTAEQMTVGATNYAARCKRERTEEKYIKHAATFWGPNEHFMEYQTSSAPQKSGSVVDRDREYGVQEMTLEDLFGDWDEREPF